ncbi:MAG: hypothetical protein ABR508_02440, partial [Candidatus Baltobacteraceae bacterium]
LPAFAPAGGSAGSVLLVMRNDYQQAPDADTDEAVLLAGRLRAEGFTVTFASARAAAPEQYDLVHLHCGAYPEQALSVLERARAAGKPVVLTPAHSSRAGEANWGTRMLPQVLRASRDETVLEDHLRMLRARKLDMPGVSLNGEPFEGYRAMEMQLEQSVGAVLPRARAPFLPEPQPAAMLLAAGTNEFILAHAPIAAAANQFMLVRAAASTGLPVVLAGPVADPEYAAHLRAFGLETLVFLAEPSPSERISLYARARVFADLSWCPAGNARRALAQAAGCRTVLSPQIDPADDAAIAGALCSAWAAEAPAPAATHADPLAAVVEAYARASTCVAAAPT